MASSFVERAVKRANEEGLQARQPETQVAAPVPSVASPEPLPPSFSLPPEPAPAPRRPAIAIGLPQLADAGLLPPEADRRRVSNEYRRIKRPLIAAAFGRNVEAVPNGRLLVIASALPGE